MSTEISISEKWQMVRFARQHDCRVTNAKGYLVKEHESRFGCEIKVYTSFPYYYMSTVDSEELLFDGKSYDEWYNNKIFEL